MAAQYDRSRSVVIASGEPSRFSAFFMNVSAAALSRVLVSQARALPNVRSKWPIEYGGMQGV